MKRTRIELIDIAERDNLARALHKALRAKRNRADVSAFMENMDDELNRLSDDILMQRLPRDGYRAFYIHDPKKRLIHAAPFRERVFHHALMNLAGPVLERAMSKQSYACRENMGVHRAIERVQGNLRRYPCYGKIDIDAYFPSIDHGCLYRLLMGRFKGKDVATLLAGILDSYHTHPGCGLPIGSLTSQYFANYYLDGLDRYLLAHPRVRAVVRYMDDVVWWCETKAEARRVLFETREWLQHERGLSVKDNAQIQYSRNGVSYCGARITREAIRLSRRKQRAYRSHKAYWERAFEQGRVDARQLQSAYAATLAITAQCDSLAWRRAVEARFPTRLEV